MRVAPKVAPKFFYVLFLREGGMAAARAFRGSRQEGSRCIDGRTNCRAYCKPSYDEIRFGCQV